jgi:Iap family predicted aminopeptidase
MKHYLVTLFMCLFIGMIICPATADTDCTSNLKTYVQKLAGDIGNRSVYAPEAMTEAETYINGLFEKWGYSVELQDCEPVKADEEIEGSDFISKNIIATREGESGKEIIIGAHYDTCDNPGANDNASGVAVMLEVARKLKDVENNHTIRFIAFANEEPPFYETGGMGSMIYVKSAVARDPDIKGVIILDGVGSYPNGANYVYIAANPESMPLANTVEALFSQGTSFPVEIMKPGTEGYDESDHWSFWEEGYEAVMFIGSFNDFDDIIYHSPEDTPEKLNYDNMAKVVEGVSSAINKMVK